MEERRNRSYLYGLYGYIGNMVKCPLFIVHDVFITASISHMNASMDQSKDI